MTLDRRAALSVCLGSALTLAGSAFMMWSRWQTLAVNVPPAPPPAIPETFDPNLSAGTGWPSTPAPTAPAVPAAPAPAPAPTVPASPAANQKRNIRFSYRSSRPTKVELVGSFNGWTAAAMAKGDNHVWSVTVPLAPGDHTYNFLVDGKPVRDPNNPRTAPEGRSLLVVKPLQ